MKSKSPTQRKAENQPAAGMAGKNGVSMQPPAGSFHPSQLKAAQKQGEEEEAMQGKGIQLAEEEEEAMQGKGIQMQEEEEEATQGKI